MTDKGHYVCYVPKNFGADAMERIKAANEIIQKYENAGMCMTLRQLYYQMVTKNMIRNHVAEYSRLGALVNDGRMAGLISWTGIEDRGRNLVGHTTFKSPQDAVSKVLASYKIDLWENQPFRPEVWVEKHALEGVVGSICNSLRVDFFAVGGYNSQSNAWRAGRRMARYIANGQKPIVFHLGDHDPSGIDMTRDNQERLSLFCGVQVQVVRLALNMNQIGQYSPPPNPAKMTDSRFADYQEKFGDESWELDALEPTVIHDLIKDAILRIRVPDLWDLALADEAHDKMELEDMVEGED